MLDYLKSYLNNALLKVRGEGGQKVISFGKVPNTLLGDLWIAISQEGLTAIDFDIEKLEFVTQTEEFTGGRLVESQNEIKEIAYQVVEYLSGNTHEINYPVDLSAVTQFQRDVLDKVSEIPRGHIVTYGDIARRLSKPKASQAVGQALRLNPVPIVIPCHRVHNADGTLGGYGGRMGSERKIKLLKLEGVIFA